MGKDIALKFLEEAIQHIKPKSVKFMQRQTKDIQLFGGKNLDRVGVSDEMLEVLTPFRRLSNKKCTLSDPKYFITKFEKELGTSRLPQNWQKMSEAEKVDYIVKDRYSRLVADNIMNNLKNEPIEHHFSLNQDGDIISHDIGNETSVQLQNDKRLIGYDIMNILLGKTEKRAKAIDIHNHPMSDEGGRFSDISDIKPYMKRMGITRPVEFAPFSPCDVRGYVNEVVDGYDLDRLSNLIKGNLGDKLDVSVLRNEEKIHF